MVKHNQALILCEGPQDKEFLNLFCKEYLKIEIPNIQDLKGKSNFFKEDSYTQIKQQVKAGMYDKILFVLDSDFEKNDAKNGGYNNTENSIKKIIKKLGFEGVADYYITCDPSTKNGNLEHLILSTMDATKKECIETFIKCVEGKEAHENKKIVLTGYKTIFKEAPYNFDHKNFEELKTKIIALLPNNLKNQLAN